MSNLNENMPARRVEDNRQAGPLAWDGAAPPAGQRTVAPITVDQLEHLNPSRTGLGVMERREGGTYVRVADVLRMDAARAAAGVPAHEQDLLDIVRTLCSAAQRLAELSPAQRANYPSPLSPMSPLFQAASAACVERGYTRWGLEIEGAAYPAPAAQPAPVAAGVERLQRWDINSNLDVMAVMSDGRFYDADDVERLLASLAPVAAEPVAWISAGQLFKCHDAIPPSFLPPIANPVPLYAAPQVPTAADVRAAALEEAAQIVIRRTSVPSDLLGAPTVEMKTRAANGARAAEEIRALAVVPSVEVKGEQDSAAQGDA